MFFQKNAFRSWHRFLMRFGANLAPFCFPNQPKPIKKLTPRGIKNLIAFGFDFWSMLDPFWEPSWSHVGHLFRPKRPPRRATMPPKTSPRPSKPPRPPQDPPKAPKTSPRQRFWYDFNEILKDFWKIFGK